MPDDYPAWLEKRHRLEGQNLNAVQPVSATFTWEAADQSAVAAKFGAGVAPDGGGLDLWITYDNKPGWNHGCIEGKAVENLIAQHKLPDDLTPIFAGTKSMAALQALITAQLKTRADDAVSVAALQELEGRRAALLGTEDFGTALWKIVDSRLPRFFYFADYSRLPYTVKISQVLTTSKDKLTESEATVKALLELGGAEQEYLTNPDYERRKRELENVANALTDDVLKYWS